MFAETYDTDFGEALVFLRRELDPCTLICASCAGYADVAYASFDAL